MANVNPNNPNVQIIDIIGEDRSGGADSANLPLPDENATRGAGTSDAPSPENPVPFQEPEVQQGDIRAENPQKPEAPQGGAPLTMPPLPNQQQTQTSGQTANQPNNQGPSILNRILNAGEGFKNLADFAQSVITPDAQQGISSAGTGRRRALKILQKSLPQRGLGRVARGGIGGFRAGNLKRRADQAADEVTEFMKTQPTQAELVQKFEEVGRKFGLPELQQKAQRARQQLSAAQERRLNQQELALDQAKFAQDVREFQQEQRPETFETADVSTLNDIASDALESFQQGESFTNPFTGETVQLDGEEQDGITFSPEEKTEFRTLITNQRMTPSEALREVKNIRTQQDQQDQNRKRVGQPDLSEDVEVQSLQRLNQRTRDLLDKGISPKRIINDIEQKHGREWARRVQASIDELPNPGQNNNE